MFLYKLLHMDQYAIMAQHIRFDQIRTCKGSNQLDPKAGLFEANKKFETHALTADIRMTP